jgi:metal-responsive CopG/Arc/MetJ family transcriptional regulator
MLHQNFYENCLPPEMVEGNIKDVKKLVEKLRRLLKLVRARSNEERKAS